MNRCAVRRMRGFAHGFRHRRMRVDGANQLFDGALGPQGQYCLGDQLGGARADDMDAEDLVVFLVGDDLHEAVELVGHARAAEHAEGERSDLHINAAVARGLFGEADTADLGVAVRAARHMVVVDRPDVLAGEPLGHQDALGR